MASLDKVYKQIEVFARECDAEKVVLFGSRARGDNLPKSDIDIAVAGCRDFGRFSYLIEERLDTLLDVDVSISTSPCRSNCSMKLPGMV